MGVEAVSNNLIKLKEAEVPELGGMSSSNTGTVPGKKIEVSGDGFQPDSGGEDTRLENSVFSATETQKYDKVMTEKAVENANNRVKSTRTNAKFEYDEDIDRVVITITDADNEIVKEIPPESTQKMLERIHTFCGILVDQEI